MSSNSPDARKRKVLNTEEAILESRTKRIKVQAQRKFAQNAATPNSTPQKPIQIPVVSNNVTKPPIKRPNTEDFLTFLCFRGTSLLPPRLDFFNKPQRSLSVQEISAGKKRRKSTPILPLSNANNEQSERKNNRQLSQTTKHSTSKLEQKVNCRNLIRSSSRNTVRQESLTLRKLTSRHGSKIIKPKLNVKTLSIEENIKRETKKIGKQVSLDGKQIQKLKGRVTRSNSLPSIFCPAINQLRDDKGKWCKGSSKSSKTSEDSKDSKDVDDERLSRKKTLTKNLDQRSNSLVNFKRKTSDVKLKVSNKNDRKTRSLANKSKSSDQDNYVVPEKKCDINFKTVSKSSKSNNLVQTKLLYDVKKRTSSVENIKTACESKDTNSSNNSRPSRRTKEAATLFMEMLRKDMRCPDEQEDDLSSVESFPDIPNTRINEQRERELKVFSTKSKVENQQNEKYISENKDDKVLPIMLDNKNTIIEKKKVKENKKVEIKIISKKKSKEVDPVDVINNENEDESLLFKRNLRPRRSSTMLDDYIMTDSEEDDDKFKPVMEVKKYESSTKALTKGILVGNSKSQKCKLNVEESAKKNLKINNKTDLKPKKDLNKIDSEIKKNVSEPKSKSILLKRDKEPEIKNIKSTAADKKTEKSSKNKTETVVITKELKTIGEGSKNAAKKVPMPNNININNSGKQQQSEAMKENVLNKKKPNLDLYNNNKKHSMSSLLTSPPTAFNGITSQNKEELLERMAEIFDGNNTVGVISKEDEKCVNNKSGSKLLMAAEKKIVDGGKATNKTIDKSVVSQKQELKHQIVSKTENVAMVVKKEENVVAEKTDEKIKSMQMMMQPFVSKVEKVENIVLQAITGKDGDKLFLKTKDINMPEYFTGKDFQLSNRFGKHDDGLSVLSEICSALPRFDKPLPFMPILQPLNDKFPTAVADTSSFVKYAPLPPPLTDSGDKKKREQSLAIMPALPPEQSLAIMPTLPPSFESRTVKIVNLARGGNNAVASVDGINDKKEQVSSSWRQAFKKVKFPKNGFTSAAVAVGNNLISWTKKNQTSDCGDIVDGKEIAVSKDLVKATVPAIASRLPTSMQINSTVEKKSAFSTAAEISDSKKSANSSYLAKTTILNSTKYDLKFEKRSASSVTAVSVPATTIGVDKPHRKDVIGDVSSSDDQSPEKKIFHQRRLSTTQSCSGNSSDAFSPDNETSVYAFQPDLPVASTPFRRNKPQSPAKSRTVSPNTSIAVSIENDSTEDKSLQSTVSSTTDVDSEEGRLFYIPLPAGVQAQPLIQGVTVKLGTEGPQNKLVMSAKLVTKPPASTIPVSSISPKPERKIKPLCSNKITNSTTPVGTVQPTTRTVQPPKSTPSTSKQVLPLSSSPQVTETKDEKKQLHLNTTSTATNISSTVKETKKKLSISSSSSISIAVKKKSKKTEKQVNNKRKSSEKVAMKKKSLKEIAEIMEAPTFYPSEEDFKDPLEYFEIVKPIAQKYGICRVVPPSSFKPECKVSDDMRFTAYNQYVHKMMNRWGPNVREMIAIRKYLETQSIVLTNPPLIGGMELDLPRLYHTVQELGGLKEVIELDKWSRVADLMKIPKSAQDRITKLDDIYCKYLLPYDTLSHDERQKLIAEVDKEWKHICKKGDLDDELYEDVNDCITKGRSIALSAYYRVARNTIAMWFKDQQQSHHGNSHSSSASNNKLGTALICAKDVESLYWKQVQEKKNHICVLSGSIDSGAEGYGFPTTKTATFTKHPWNLKVLTNNAVSVLKSLGPVMGMTVPTIHMGMVFSACCWYKDPHGLPWIEYLHTGADKVWYGVPCDQSDRFRAAMKRLLPQAVAEGQNHHTWLAADSGMVPPDKLLEHGVSVTRTVQTAGQFLIVMPHAYTCNVSTGYVISESVYFTQSGWLDDAEKIFQDLQRNCEPAAFSFEKLLINMSTDSRTPQNLLKQLLNVLSNMRDCEVALRSQLVEDLGLKASERIKPKSAKTSKSNVQNEDYECDVCHSILYISMVNNSHEDCNYCLRHGIEILSKKHNQLKYFKFLYTFDEADLDSILVKLRERIDSKKKKTSIKSS